MRYVFRILVLAVVTLLTLILLKSNLNLKNGFYEYVYTKNISFATINNWYHSLFGSSIPFSDYINEYTPVFNEKINYKSKEKYKDGVALNVDYEYLVPALDNGIVIFVGNKEGYGNTVILQQENGVDVWYSNLEEINVKLYDYILKGSLIGNVNEQLYLVFIKDGVIINEEDYI